MSALGARKRTIAKDLQREKAKKLLQGVTCTDTALDGIGAESQ